MTDQEKHLENEWSKAMQDFLEDDEDDAEAHGSANSPRLMNVKKADASTHIISLKGTGSRKKRNELHEITLQEMVVSINTSEAASSKTKQFLQYALGRFKGSFGSAEKLDPLKHDLTNLALRFDSLADKSIEYIISRYMVSQAH